MFCQCLRKSLFSLVAAMVMLSGCSSSYNDTEPLIIGSSYWPGYEPLYLAKHDNTLPQNVSVNVFESASEVLNQYRGGKVQSAALTLDEVITLKSQGYHPKIIAVLDQSNGADVIMANPAIRDMASLKGKSVAVEPGALGAFILSRALALGNVDPDTLTILPIATFNLPSAYKDGIADAVVTFEPYRTQLMHLGAKEIFSSKQIPGEIVDVLVVKEAYYSKERARKIIDGYYRAVLRLKRRDPEAIALMAAHLHQSPAEFLSSLQGIKFPDPSKNDILLKDGTIYQTVQKLQKTMLKEKLIEKGFDPSEIIISDL